MSARRAAGLPQKKKVARVLITYKLSSPLPPSSVLFLHNVTILAFIHQHAYFYLHPQNYGTGFHRRS